jgi:NAD(P)-dependent dehydrogenase (short-subunit alcohol dehydrogenase family)
MNEEMPSYKPFFDLTGKVALVTGGAGILGQRFCRGLAEYGAKVVVVDIRMEAARELATDLQDRHSTESLGVACDVSDPDSVKEMLSTVISKFGEVNILLNNAASKSENLEDFFAPFEEYSLSEWQKVMATNIDGMFLVSQAVGKQMLAQAKGGSIVQTASIYGVAAPDNRIYEGSEYLGMKINTPAVYAASKAAVIGLTRYLAAYWADKNIRVNTLIPGGVESGQNATFVKNYSNRVPMQRMGKPDEFVGAMLFLASDASSYVTGQEVVVDGGLLAW